jgi:hypothetical protein
MSDRDQAIAVDDLMATAGVETHGITREQKQRLAAVARGVLDGAGWPAGDSAAWDDAVGAFADAVDAAARVDRDDAEADAAPETFE